MAETPYADAPRLPEEGPVDPRVVLGAPPGEPVELEIGPGRGWFLVERVAVDAGIRILGLEIRRKWAKIVDDRLAALGLGGRARCFAEDARLVLPRVPDGCLSRIFIHFPDPWWKQRHRKRLVVADELVTHAARALVPGGDLLVQTDVDERAAEYEAVVSAEPAFEPAPGGPRVSDHAFVARSPRERRAMADGLPIHRLHFVRRT